MARLGSAAQPAQGGVRPQRELKSQQLFGRQWARLGAERQLHLSHAAAPLQAGPLNSQRLVLQALQQMQALSPDYLQHFLAQVEGLRALAQIEAAQIRPPNRPTGPKVGQTPAQKSGQTHGQKTPRKAAQKSGLKPTRGAA